MFNELTNNSYLFILNIKNNIGETMPVRVQADSIDELAKAFKFPVILFEPVRKVKDATPFLMITHNIRRVDFTPNNATNFHNEQEVYKIKGF